MKRFLILILVSAGLCLLFMYINLTIFPEHRDYSFVWSTGCLAGILISEIMGWINNQLEKNKKKKEKKEENEIP